MNTLVNYTPSKLAGPAHQLHLHVCEQAMYTGQAIIIILSKNVMLLQKILINSMT